MVLLFLRAGRVLFHLYVVHCPTSRRRVYSDGGEARKSCSSRTSDRPERVVGALLKLAKCHGNWLLANRSCAKRKTRFTPSVQDEAHPRIPVALLSANHTPLTTGRPILTLRGGGRPGLLLNLPCNDRASILTISLFPHHPSSVSLASCTADNDIFPVHFSFPLFIHLVINSRFLFSFHSSRALSNIPADPVRLFARYG